MKLSPLHRLSPVSAVKRNAVQVANPLWECGSPVQEPR